jgi:diadenosine tetraphosphate (Ap4A) HIT family hydrolase
VNCPFCDISPDLVLQSTEHARAFLDAYPVSKGHCLVVPKAHVESIFDLPTPVQAEIWTFVAEMRDILLVHYRFDGVNIGLNDGQTAGQTVMHAHIHIIPRYEGDVPDPRGGIRWIFPEKARYW